jgi:hypothetical protein
MSRLDQILDALNRHHQRATYGAVAGLVGAIPRAVLSGRKRDWRHSWVVNEETGKPTDYSELRVHPSLEEKAHVISSSEELQHWLVSASANGAPAT